MLTNLKYTLAFEYPLKAKFGVTNAIISKMASAMANRLIVSSPSSRTFFDFLFEKKYVVARNTKANDLVRSASHINSIVKPSEEYDMAARK